MQVNFVLENWISSGDNKGRCGTGFTAPSGVVAECDPNSEYPCCSQWVWCNKDCNCEGCQSYSVTGPVNVDVPATVGLGKNFYF